MISLEKTHHIQKRIKAIVSDILNVDVTIIKPDTKLKSELNIDSLELAELLLHIESEFKVYISDTHAQKIQTMQELVDYISQQPSRK